MIKILNYINGQKIEPIKGEFIDNYNPSNGSIYSILPNSSKEDVELAFESAQASFENWKNTPAEKKFKILNRIAELIDLKNEELAKAETIDQGKPLWLAKAEIMRAAQNFRFFATAAMQYSSESHSMENLAINYTLKQPIGVVGCISPWNLPLYLFSWKVAPALATGNCVIAKPSELTPMTAFLLSDICTEAGLPKGVLNILHGLGSKVGQAMVEHPYIKAISFTGGTATGKHIASVAAPMFKKLSLELGGKNPVIIFDDCDFDKMMKTTVMTLFQNQGEICLCGSRIFVQNGIYEKFKIELTTYLKSLKVGKPLNEDTKVGAIVSEQHFNKVLSYIKLAKQEGGTILFGGKSLNIEESGWYIEPTVIEGLSNNCQTNQEEIFGPVVSLIPFENVEEVLNYANDVKYGLAATIWTKDIEKAHGLANQIQAGIVWINCWLLRDLRTPFGGIKQSGVGREGGWYAMNFFTEPKNVCVKYN